MNEHALGLDQLRPGQADRKVIADRLRWAVDEGRLDLHEYDERLRNAYAAKTYGELERIVADLPVPPKQELPALVQLGDISVSSTTIDTPVGSTPLHGSQWTISDRWVVASKTPAWAIVLAVVLFPVGLLFLLAKGTVLRGGIHVTVAGGGLQHDTWIPVFYGSQVYRIHERISSLRAVARWDSEDQPE